MVSFTADQKFIVTGASSGIGECVALTLNEAGASVVGIARNAEKLAAMKAKARHPENIFVEVKDLAVGIPALPSYMKDLKVKYGKFSGLACCAGVGWLMSLQSLDFDEMHRMFDVNYFSPIFMAKGFADRRVNVGRGSAIVAIASIGGIVAEKGQTTYAGTKAGLAASFKSIARELIGQGIRVNCVSPGMVDTPMTAMSDEEYLKKARESYALGFAQPKDIANMIVFLLSADAKWISGQNYIMDCATY